MTSCNEEQVSRVRCIELHILTLVFFLAGSPPGVGISQLVDGWGEACGRRLTGGEGDMSISMSESTMGVGLSVLIAGAGTSTSSSVSFDRD